MLFITDGGRALRAWLKANGSNIPKFSDLIGFHRIQVQRYVDGERKRVPVDFAVAVERATNGEIVASAWTSSTVPAALESTPQLERNSSKTPRTGAKKAAATKSRRKAA